MYELDVTGTLVDNRVTNEIQDVIITSNLYNLIIPRYAVYFGDSVSIYDTITNSELIEDVDYTLTHYSPIASMLTGKAMYGSITFYTARTISRVRLSYQTLGGEWIISADNITEILSRTLANPRVTTWEQVADAPSLYAPLSHLFNTTDLVGMTELVTSLSRIEDAILANANRPVQLPLFSTNEEINAGVSTNTMVSPAGLKLALTSIRNGINYATLESGVLGISSNTIMSPLVTKEVITRALRPYAIALSSIQQDVSSIGGTLEELSVINSALMSLRTDVDGLLLTTSDLNDTVSSMLTNIDTILSTLTNGFNGVNYTIPNYITGVPV